jgi:DNA-binding response OmpR family regulator
MGEGASARRPRVLVVEDSILDADEIASVLSDTGFDVAGPAATRPPALDLALHADLDAAVLDVRLHDDTVFPVASVLAARHVPFMFLTAVRPDTLPAEFSSVPVLAKPYDPQELCRMVRSLVRRPWLYRQGRE